MSLMRLSCVRLPCAAVIDLAPAGPLREPEHLPPLTIAGMKAVLVDVPPALLEERRRIGADKADEMWDGVLHMVPPASALHQRVGARLFRLLAPLAEARGLVAFYETGLFRADNDYRVPDQLYVRPELVSDRGVEGPADLLVEIRSPSDEIYDKIDWYAALGVRELLIVHPGERRVELLRGTEDRLVVMVPDADGAVRSDVLEVEFRPAPGPRLVVEWTGGQAEI